ncbi:hypothetical protein M3M35_05325 [Fructilactobacillus myrtifloralis]|uniref:Oligosaccharide repeat unit polymerase n=1 Tax=Fructilactobacillus myrtifloralis TaxID=2940301 RepID=A0ABY5BQQ5_9LACO|nr:hypothetical protein [Fructilactobacillus myrtifloralis]USS84729.1 hypothetical protein M3M35_05325 [Fructilactobacillus myrtifloralis]
MEYFSILLVVGKTLFLDNLTRKQKVIFVVIGLLLVISAKISKSHDLVNSYFFICASTGISLRKIFKTSFVYMTIALVFTVVAALSGLIINLIYVRNGIFRFSLGEGYTTVLSSIIFFILASIAAFNLASRNKKTIIMIFSLIFLLSFVVYQITDTRTDLICMLLLSFVTLWRYYGNFLKNKFVRGFILISPALVFLWTLISAYFFNPQSEAWQKLNQLFSNRLSLVSEATIKYPIKFLGRYIVEHGNGNSLKPVLHYFYIDSSFSRVLFLNGLFAFIFLYIVIQFAFYLIIKKNQPLYTALSLILVIIFIEGTFSSMILSVGFNSILFILNIILSKKGTLTYD